MLQIYVTGAADIELREAGGGAVLASAQPTDSRSLMRLWVPPAAPLGNYEVTDGSVSTELRVVSGKLLVVQTDKPLYKPGQTVQFRVLCFSRALRPLASPVTLAILNPKGFKIAELEDTADAHGVAEFELPLAAGISQGDYVVSASAGDESQGGAQVTFKIDEYVLPRFSVQVNLAQSELHVSRVESNFLVSGAVDARYTYGEPVKGQVKLQIFEKSSCTLFSYRWASSPCDQAGRLVSTSLIDTVGLFNITVDSTDGAAFDVTATVTDDASGDTESSTAELKLLRSSYAVEFDVPETFKPGLPFEAQVIMHGTQQPTGVTLEVTHASPGYQDLRAEDVPIQFETLSSGKYRAKITHAVPPDNTSCCNALQPASDYRERQRLWQCCVGGVNLRVKLPDSDLGYMNDRACIGRAWSMFGVFLNAAIADDGAHVQFNSTTEPAHVDLVVTSGGRILTSTTPPISQQAQVMHESGWSYWTGSVELPPGIGTKFMAHVTVTDTGGRKKASASVSSNGAFQWPFASTIGFQSTEPRSPGENITIHNTATDGSKVFVCSVDTAIGLLGSGGGGAVTEASVSRAVEGARDVSSPPQAYANCNDFTELDPAWQAEGLNTAVLPAETTTQCSPVLSTCGHGMHLEPEMAVLAGAAPEMRLEDAAADAAADMPAGAVAKTKTRTYFPETWIWRSLAANEAIQETVPDSLTTWELSAFATHPSDGISVSSSTAGRLAVKKDLYADVVLPYSIIRGEVATLRLMVVSHVAEELSCSLAVRSALVTPEVEGLLLLNQAPETISVRANGVYVFDLQVQGQEIGHWPLTAAVQCGGGLDDAVQRALLVEPEGKFFSHTQTVLMDLSTGTFEHQLDVAFPADTVAGSTSLRATVVGDLLGPTMSNLEHLVRVPTGCGEQNMIGLAPNVYVFGYLQTIGRLSHDLRKRCLRNMLIGYQRQLNYRLSDGSFSAFGESDGEGSLWLTAFVLRVLSDAAAHVAMDAAVLEAAITWLIARQLEDGSFPPTGRVIHQEMMGGGAGGNSLTAFVLLALKRGTAAIASITNRAVPDDQQAAMNAAAAFVDGRFDTATLYGKVLGTYALLSTDFYTADDAAQRVLSVAVRDDAGLLSWQPQSEPGGGAEEPSRRTRGRHGRAVGVELTAYGILTLVLGGRLSDALAAVRWLLRQQNDLGGFYSTHDTVIALRALTSFATAVDGTTDMTVSVSGSQGSASAVVNADNFDLVQSFELQAQGGTLNITSTGTGMALAKVVASWNAVPSQNESCFDLTVTWSKYADRPDTCGVHACVRPTCEDRGSMSLVKIGLFSGFAADAPSVDMLRSQVDLVELDGRSVNIYLPEVPDGLNCYDFDARQTLAVGELQPVASEVIDYYAPEKAGVHSAAWAMVQDQGPTEKPRLNSSSAAATFPGAIGVGLLCAAFFGRLIGAP